MSKENKKQGVMDVIKENPINNHKQIKAKLKGMSPVQYRIHTLSAA